MSDGPGLALQKALVATLRADPGLTLLIGGRVYDTVPKGAAFPYVSLGEEQTLPDRGDGYDGSDLVVTLHVWSRATGLPEAKRIGHAIRIALSDGLALGPDHRLVDLRFDETRALREPDGETGHTVLTFTASTEPV